MLSFLRPVKKPVFFLPPLAFWKSIHADCFCFCSVACFAKRCLDLKPWIILRFLAFSSSVSPGIMENDLGIWRLRISSSVSSLRFFDWGARRFSTGTSSWFLYPRKVTRAPSGVCSSTRAWYQFLSSDHTASTILPTANSSGNSTAAGARTSSDGAAASSGCTGTPCSCCGGCTCRCCCSASSACCSRSCVSCITSPRLCCTSWSSSSFGVS
mmetsp:Transcript_3955/g.14050  ORF Transcript_3955/g.14050 Transcript_3955/m.14050 type:complete len:212 (-) Transcript_3955:299-934(-)